MHSPLRHTLDFSNHLCYNHDTMKTKDEEERHLSVRISGELLDQADEKAKRNWLTLSSVVRALLRAWVRGKIQHVEIDDE